MKKIYYIGAIIGAILLSSSLVQAAPSVFQPFQGGTGTSTPSGILYGSNSGSTALQTVSYSGCTFSGGVLTCNGTGSPFPFTPGTNFGAAEVSTSTTVFFQNGLQASSTIQFGNASASNFTYDSANGALDLGAFSSLANTPLRISTTTNNFIQALVQNLSNGNNATSEFVASNDKDSTSNTYYFDMGIDGSGFNQASFNSENPSDAFLTSSDTGLVIGTASSTNTAADIRFVTGGTASSSIRAVIAANGSVGIGTTTPWAYLSINPNGIAGPAFAIGSSTQTLFSVGNMGSTTMGRFGTCGGSNALTTNSSGVIVCGAISGFDTFAWPFTVAANGGVSTSTLVQLLGNASSTQISIPQKAYFGSTATTTIDNAGNIADAGTLSVTGNASTTKLSANQFWAGSTGTTTITTAGFVGVGTSSPFAAISLDRQVGFSSSTIAINEYNYGTATSTNELIDCRSGAQQHLGIGIGAQTIRINASSLIPGQHCIVIVENPNASAGALTWQISAGAILEWVNGTAPTQTTTANAMDLWSFTMTHASSTNVLIGEQAPNIH